MQILIESISSVPESVFFFSSFASSSESVCSKNRTELCLNVFLAVKRWRVNTENHELNKVK